MSSVALSELIAATREEILALKNDLFFRSGDSVDPRNAETPVASVSLTRQINKAVYDILSECRFNMSNETLSFGIGVREVALPTDWIDVVAATVASLPLRKTNVSDLDNREPRWRTVPNGTPRRFYLNAGSAVGLDVPLTAITNISFLVVKSPTALSALADTVPSYPINFSYLISTRAAWHCCKIDTNNPAAQAREKLLSDAYNAGITTLKEFISGRMAFDNDAPRKMQSVTE